MEEGYSDRKKELSAVNRVVIKPLPRIDKKSVLPLKKKKKYTPTVMMRRINKYFAWCEDNDEFPNIKAMMIHMKLYQEAFYYYVKDPAYRDMLEHARLIIVNWAEEDVYNTKGMAAGKLAYMKNIHSWADKIETKNENYNETKVIDVATATKKIEMLAPRLLELLENSEIVKQIGKSDSIEAEVVND